MRDGEEQYPDQKSSPILISPILLGSGVISVIVIWSMMVEVWGVELGDVHLWQGGRGGGGFHGLARVVIGVLWYLVTILLRMES